MIASARNVVFAAALLVPSLAAAAPITSGIWSPVGPVNADGSTFWDGKSADCLDCGVGAFLTLFGPVEYLHDGTGKSTPFHFVDPEIPWTMLFSLSKWKGTLSRRDDGAFTYDSGTGHVSNSLDENWQYALFRQVGPDTTRYFLGVEDIRFDLPGTTSDRDYNDFVATFTLASIPEPSSLLLMSTAILGFAVRRFRTHKAPGARPISSL